MSYATSVLIKNSTLFPLNSCLSSRRIHRSQTVPVATVRRSERVADQEGTVRFYQQLPTPKAHRVGSDIAGRVWNLPAECRHERDLHEEYWPGAELQGPRAGGDVQVNVSRFGVVFHPRFTRLKV